MLRKLSVFVFFMILGLMFQVGAFQVPTLTGPVVDQVGLISARTQRSLTEALKQAQVDDGPQVQVLVLNSLEGEAIEQVAIAVFDQWKLGNAKKDNGVLFLIAPHEKKLRIEVGRGLEGQIPDAIAKRIVSDTVAPYFKRRDYDMGISQGVAAILHYAGAADLVAGAGGANSVGDSQQNQDQQEKSDSQGSDHSKIIFFIIVLFWIALFIFNPSLAMALFLSGRGGRGGGGGWSGGSGGGWSGGGGDSAGGGASGDW